MTRRDSQRGFALLLTLLLVLIAGAVLAGMARLSATRALNALEAKEQLQRRWATDSIQRTLLPRVESIFQAHEKQERMTQRVEQWRPISSMAIECRLAGIDYELILTDEQAKVDVNALVAEYGRAEAEGLVRRLMLQTGVTRNGRGLRVELTTEAGADAGKGKRVVHGFGQVFREADPALLVGAGRSPGAADRLTCWGGRLNVHRADDRSIETLCGKALGPRIVTSLLAARKENPELNLPQLKAKLGTLDTDESKKIERFLTDHSQCHGIWVRTRGDRRNFSTLMIDVVAAQDAHQLRFHW